MSPDTTEIAKCLVKIADKSVDGWFEYGIIKKQCGTDSAQRLDDAIHNKILVKKNNLYRFRTKAINDAAISLFSNQ